MTLRDYFAGQALTGMLANPGLFGDDMLGKDAYAIADAMLAERNAYDENYFDACRLCGDRVYIPHLKNHQCPEPQP